MRQDTKKLERIIKGFANHRRIEILRLLEKSPELSVAEVADVLNVNFKTISVHIARLNTAGLIMKRYEGSNVRHKVTPLGISILTFLRMLE